MVAASSLRSSDRRRYTALRGVETSLVGCCLNADRFKGSSQRFTEGTLTLASFVGLQIHTSLVNLLTRHTQTLSRQSQLRPEDISTIVNELSLIIGILQGLCLLSTNCKTSLGEPYVLEILIDLLLLLRTQPPPTVSTPNHTSASDGSPETRSIVYSILDLLCCVLVDSPVNARAFERLSGLEAVVRVLKGTGVAKEIRMKCLEFLYFYLLPENSQPPPRAVSSSSTSSSSSGESLLYPPSPLSSSTSSIGSNGRISPSPLPKSQSHSHFQMESKYRDLDIPFIPQTPKKPVQPSLGYLTPSTHHRRVSGSMSMSSTPSLAPVPASPREMPIKGERSVPEMPSTRHMQDDRRWSVMETPSVNAGLGLGLPKSSSVSTDLSTVARDGPPPIVPVSGMGLKRDVTAVRLDRQLSDDTHAPTFTDPFSETRSSSGSSTAVPPTASRQSSGMSRSSTQPSLSLLASQPGREGMVQRRTSARRSSKSPLVQSSIPALPKMNPPLSRQGDSSLLVPSSTGAPRAPKMRHSRTQSLLSALPPPSPAVPPMPRVPSVHRHTPSTPSRADADNKAQPTPQPTPARRAFPSELTRGIPPSASSPSLSRLAPPTPLGASKRIPSDKRGSVDVAPSHSEKDNKKGKKDVKSVEEKKELRGSAPRWVNPARVSPPLLPKEDQAPKMVAELVDADTRVSVWEFLPLGEEGGIISDRVRY
ncbi:cell division control protein 14, SIN component-domain-containing protein [Naematelia encephala]|uniref:Cell division control protein 14, SIN component-domain-containing protein n=1 Tax=Naematelia encephala TaxID=71784 RepID=A0A1Y2ALS5_9TREE|nr:cell division control protein 14, SIN component-domain-containing protein [Naematelia encephala]